MPGAIVFQGRKHFVIPDTVAIDFGLRGESRVKRCRYKAASHDANRWRQDAIQSRPPAIGAVTSFRKISVRALRKSVHARVSAPCAVNPHALRTDLLECVFQMVLNPVVVRLALPAGKRRAVVSNNQLQPRRHRAVRNRESCSLVRYPDSLAKSSA